ncbi:MAG: hypothetical protein ABR558_09220 [Thioalkalivibrio sp.]
MNRLSPAHDILPRDGFEWGEVRGMPAPLNAPQRLATWLVDLSPLSRVLVKGGDAAGWLRARELPVPEEWFVCHELPAHGPDAFLARTGNAEFLLHDGPSGGLARHLGPLPEEALNGTRVLIRDDQEIALGGEHAVRLMAEFCSLDLSRSGDGLIYTRVAGVGVWLRVETGPVYRMGCEPSYGEYLFETLMHGVREMQGEVIGFSDFYTFRED